MLMIKNKITIAHPHNGIDLRTRLSLTVHLCKRHYGLTPASKNSGNQEEITTITNTAPLRAILHIS
jgi:hypothetical protein